MLTVKQPLLPPKNVLHPVKIDNAYRLRITATAGTFISTDFIFV